MQPRFPLPRLVRRAAALLALAAWGCGRGVPGGAGDVTLTVSAAASLREVMTATAERYRAGHPGVRVRLNFGASGALRQQIEHGAAVDVFVSASEGQMDALAKRGLVDARSRRILAGNELVLVVPAGVPPKVKGFAELASPTVGRVAVGAPGSVPAGEYAEETFRSLGIADAVARKTVYAQNVRQVLTYVESGNVDAGVVYRTDALASDRVRVVAPAPPGSHRPVVYPVAVVSASGHPREAQALVAYLTGPAGRAELLRRGFRVGASPAPRP
ncbi:MAG: molybdate ABC transporter substrate-binding protein [Gemmatimonadetes bacterium]|nr:molybdate ABC transporter substrate-binding protein [Gemmatimonadota bacterium]